jgi:TRAP-type C4-dicarboxylate transport system permease small subunit
MLATLVKRVNKVSEHFLNILLIIMVVVVFLQVIFRFLITIPLSWSEEVSRYIMVWTTFLGAALAVEKKAHPYVEVLVNLLPLTIRIPMNILIICLCCVFYAILVFYGTMFVTTSVMQPSAALEIPMGYVYIVIPVGGILLILNSLAEMQAVWKKREGGVQ